MSWSKEARIIVVGAVALGGVATAELGARAFKLELVPDLGIVRNVSLSDRNILVKFPWAKPDIEKWYISSDESAQKLLNARGYLALSLDKFPQGYQMDVLGPVVNDRSPRYGVLNVKKVENALDLRYEAEGKPGPRLAVRLNENSVAVQEDDSTDTGIRWLSALFARYGTPVNGEDQMRLGDERRNLLYYDEFGQSRKG